MKKRILFVDDEPSVLHALGRMLRRARHEWDMEFAGSGQEALDRLAASAVDVVVSDVRMPGMDGSELLQRVRERYPTAVRIALSGQCDRQTALKAVGPTHQFLSKPCDSETLKSTVARACRLYDRLDQQQHKRIVSHIQSIPSLPAVYAELVTELESPDASIRRAGQIVSRDVGMTAKVLQLVSSGFFGTPQQVASPSEAVSLLGLDTIRPLAFSADAFSPFSPHCVHARSLEILTEHSLAVAEAARAIAEAESNDPALIGGAYLAGMLHDVGLFVLAHYDPQHFLAAQATCSRTTHADLGASLLGLWGLPDPIVEAVAQHHRPDLPADRPFGPLAAVRAADALQNRRGTNLLGATRPADINSILCEETSHG